MQFKRFLVLGVGFAMAQLLVRLLLTGIANLGGRNDIAISSYDFWHLPMIGLIEQFFATVLFAIALKRGIYAASYPGGWLKKLSIGFLATVCFVIVFAIVFYIFIGVSNGLHQ